MSTAPDALALWCVIAFAASWALTAAARRWAIRTRLLDVPNERSSHLRPTPRGGGVAIVATYIGAVLVASFGPLDHRLAFALVGGGGMVAALGLADDRYGLSARWRLLDHAMASAWTLTWLPTLAVPTIYGLAIPPGLPAATLAFVSMVWMINLSNFMDGIDGLASVQAICVALGGAIAWWIADPAGPWWLGLVLAACVGGFLTWNIPPAKIFMGDAGSGFLGIVIATLALWSAQQQPMLLWSWFILCGLFIVDATVTLGRRVLQGEKFYLAHRSHAYQYASRRHASHAVVTSAVAAIDMGWLLPWALAVATGRCDGALAALIAYAPLVLLVFHYKAGNRAGQGTLA